MLRLVLMGVGLGLITGSLLKLAGPAVEEGDLVLPAWLPLSENNRKGENKQAETSAITAPNRTESLGRFETRNELKPLSERWKALAAEQPDLKVSAFMLVLDDGRYAELQPDTALPAASSIKTPILLLSLIHI